MCSALGTHDAAIAVCGCLATSPAAATADTALRWRSQASSVLLPVPPLDVSAAVAGAAVRFHVTTHAGEWVGREPARGCDGQICDLAWVGAAGRSWQVRVSWLRPVMWLEVGASGL